MSKHEELIERLRCFDRLACNDAIGVIEAQAREIEGLRKKAERYDWLREAGAWESEILLDSFAPEEFDSRVDAYMASEKRARNG